jgi:hypothetical protein
LNKRDIILDTIYSQIYGLRLVVLQIFPPIGRNTPRMIDVGHLMRVSHHD